MKKVLIITYYWPPAGGPGVQRWLKFVKYLPDYNIQPIVYIPENPTYPIIDEGLISEVSEQAIILKNKIIEPYQLASVFSKKSTKGISSGIIPNQKKQSFIQKILLLVRGNLFIPDARILWVKPSVKYLEKYISENNIDTIITSGPPHSLHLIGLKLKQNLNVKWFADFRDPWTTIGYHSALKLSSYAEKKHKNLERKVLNTADTIIVTSKTTKTEFQAITTKPIEVITNGYDVENISKQTLDEKFTLAHIGSFLSDRNPIILWESLSELVAENEKFATLFQLKLIGKVSQEILDTIDGFNLNSYVNNLGYVSHKEAIEHQKKSQVLLLIEIDSEDTKSIIPGKLFEYMVSERPIIGIGPKGSDFAEIITETNTGVFFTYNEKEKLKKQILSYFELYLTQKLTVSAVGLQQYSRKKLTEKLSKLIS
ncbi:glycosyltransferase family 4 protein [Flavobacterium psychrophilum]|uniref:Glycosyl transferase, group 1 family protein n=1 Tax=Flavobacterium psychrophilum (strain ATCC 49511 / DSM 21280 / CIP 103535 / JIP02/86) TaxID=402612 RepID=A6H0J0_FLAPJ|nr:glycosyltransferase family 4 protein [Flavobacterium psychrophilum]ELY1978482.1 glycosyltransferase family 4 protein [Flavobacterium psychrophilum]MCB5970676.1 glycosyltransferase family 4 protein [Flavobacterium psychrophilum]MCB5978322.1 glycosyltransferase family 4 protein [Flavobacterium psychrophilum]MCB6064209.1 glycosyltransferase family 4 protein [Flavobacterium psychrophilum]MCB6065902.1 glycosyltransferase family 4 protein [Flavobacterium psychrophilum]